MKKAEPQLFVTADYSNLKQGSTAMEPTLVITKGHPYENCSGSHHQPEQAERDIVARLEEYNLDWRSRAGSAKEVTEAIAEIKKLREFVAWVDVLVSNPAGAYSISALDGLFGMTRDKIAALSRS